MSQVTQSSAPQAAEELTIDLDKWLGEVGSRRTPEERAFIRRAAERAREAHAGQQRASGRPYLEHVLAVAGILNDLRLDQETIAAALLHDVVEDTEVTLGDVRAEFGDTVAQLVDGVTKMGQISGYRFADVGELKGREQSQAESLRKMLLAMVDDVRVVLIKLADRLHNMRTLGYLDQDRQRRIAQETLDIYGPLANRLGIGQIKWELEDLSLRYLEPDTYREVARLLDERRVDRERYIQRVLGLLKSELNKAGIGTAEVTGRPKHAVRILVDDVAQCYAALGVVHSLWHYIPKEFDDYIANPKDNLYRSLHTAVVGPEDQTLEIQIRTREMHRHAELGVAAHWRYKEGTHFDPGFELKIAWLRQLLNGRTKSPRPARSWTGSSRKPAANGYTCSRPGGRWWIWPRARRRWISPTPSTPMSDIAVAGPRSTAAWSR
ncbi:MAG: HD domain-containing protein [Gammaproteobacteria bacterium]